MTVSAQTPRLTVDIPAGTIAVPVPFFVENAGDLSVWLGVDNVYRPLHAEAWTYSGGVLTTAAGPGVLSVIRQGPLVQPVQLPAGAPLYPRVIEAGLDRLARQIQDLDSQVNRSVRLHPAVPGVLPAVGQPVPGGVLVLDAAGGLIRFDPVLAGQVIGARDQAVAAAAQAVAAQTEAYYSQVEAKASQVAARGAAEAAFFFRNEAEQFALRAEAAQDVVLRAAERASYALGLMGIANNLTQILYVVAPFLAQTFGIWRDLGWVNEPAQIVEDLGWVCSTPTGNCLDFGLISDTVTDIIDFSADGPARDWGLLSEPAPCETIAAVTCHEDLGWVNSVIPMNPDQAIKLPIHVPDPCPVIVVDPPVPPAPPPSYNSGHC